MAQIEEQIKQIDEINVPEAFSELNARMKELLMRRRADQQMAQRLSLLIGTDGTSIQNGRVSDQQCTDFAKDVEALVLDLQNTVQCLELAAQPNAAEVCDNVIQQNKTMFDSIKQKVLGAL